MTRRLVFFSFFAVALPQMLFHACLAQGPGFSQTKEQVKTPPPPWQEKLKTPTLPAGGAGDFQDVTASVFGFSTRWKRLGWGKYEAMERNFPAAHMGASMKGRAWIVVVPVHLGQVQADLAAVMRGFFMLLPLSDALTEKKAPGWDVREMTTSVGAPCADLRWIRPVQVGNAEFSIHRARVVQVQGGAILIAAWVVPGDGVDEDTLNFAIESVDTGPMAPLAEEVELGVEQHRIQAEIINEIGLDYHRREDYARAVPLYARAWRMRPFVQTFLANCVDAAQRSNDSATVLSLLESERRLWADNPDIHATYAKILSETGQTGRALEEYAALFKRTLYVNDTAFGEYLGLLLSREQAKEALEVMAAYVRRQPNSRMLRWQASLLSQENKHQESLAILEDLLKRQPDQEVALELAATYNIADQPEKAEEVLQRLISHGVDTSRVRMSLGASYMRRKWYAKGKEQFELVLKRDPEYPEVKAAIESASAALGQGDNSRIKEEITPVPLPDEIALLAAEPRKPTDEQVRGYGAYYESYVTGTSFTPEKELTTTTRMRVRVLDKGGVTRFSTMQFGFDPLGEQIFVNRLAVYDAAGRLVAEGKADQYYVADDTSSGLATHDKNLKAPVPGLQPGFLIEAVVTRRDTYAEKTLRFGREWMMHGSPCSHRVMYVLGEARHIGWHASAGLKTERREGLVFCHAMDLPAFVVEPYLADLSTFVPSVCIGDPAATWKGVAEEYMTMVKDRMEVSPETWSAAWDVGAAPATKEAKLAAILRFIQERIHYEGIEFGRRARIPHPATATLANKYGDCKDHAVLLYQMLRGAEIEAHLMLVDTRNDVIEPLPSLDQFNHMIVHVPSNNKNPFIDTTQKFLPIETMQPESVAGRLGLVLDEKKPRLVRIPPVPADSNVITSQRTVEANKEGRDALVSETLILDGYVAGWFRASFDEVDPADHLRRMQSFISGAENVRLEQFQFENLKDIVKPARLQMTYTVPGAFEPRGPALSGRLPSVWEADYLRASFVKERKSPFEIRMPLVIRTYIRLSGGLRLDEGVPFATCDSRSPFSKWSLMARPDSRGGELVFQYEADMGAHAAADYARFHLDRSAAMEALGALRLFKR